MSACMSEWESVPDSQLLSDDQTFFILVRLGHINVPRKYAKKYWLPLFWGGKNACQKKITASKKLNKCVGQYFSQIAMVIAARKKIVWRCFEAFLWRCNFFWQGLFFSRTSISGRLKWGIWPYGLNDQLRKTFFAFPARPGLGQHKIMASYDDFDVYCPPL